LNSASALLCSPLRWAVHDAASAVLIGDLAQNIIAGNDATEVLGGAQLKLLRGSPKFGPYVWAGYRVFGS
jgi:CHAT domain-containing protein